MQTPSKAIVITRLICGIIISAGSVLMVDQGPITMQKVSASLVPLAVAVATSVAQFIDRSFAQYQEKQAEVQQV
jgi:hypothetical protein